MSAVTWDVPDFGVDTAGASPVRRPRLSVVPGGAAAPAARVGSLRITRAGRLAVTAVLALAVVSSLVWMLIAPSAVPTHRVTVQSGQTLSDIAVAQLPEVSMRDGVALIMSASDLTTDQVSAGQVITVPTR